MAGTLKLNNIQLGDSVTATNNFSLVNNQDGSITLARGNVGATSQDVLKIDASGNVTTVNGVPLQKMLSIPAKATTSGTFVDFSPADGTGIPSWAKKVTINVDKISTNGTSPPALQLGSGAIHTTSYGGSTTGFSGSSASTVASSTTRWNLRNGTAAADIHRGHILLTLAQGTTWLMSANMSDVAGSTSIASGAVTLAGALDSIRLTTVNGTDTFDAGSVSLLIEGY